MYDLFPLSFLFQVRCKYAPHCSEEGTKVVVTDHGEGDHTDFILSPRAYNKLARPGQAEILFSYGVVDIEYKRIPCQYPGYNLVFKVHEHSRFPEYLALIAIYQAGVSEITAVELWQVRIKLTLKILEVVRWGVGCVETDQTSLS